MVTLQWASIERGRCRAVRRQKNTQATRGEIAVRARPSAPTTHYLLPSSPYSLLLLLFSFPDCGENLREELFFSGEDTCHIVDILPDLLIWQCLGNALRGE